MPAGAWDNEFAYLQARVRARVSMLPRAADWAALGPLNEAAHYLQRARNTRIAVLLPDAFSTFGDIHAFEAGLRGHLRDAIRSLARWSPRRAADLIECCALLPHLALLEHLRLGGEAYPWAAMDGGLRAAQEGLGGELVARARKQGRSVVLLWLEWVEERLAIQREAPVLADLLRILLERHPLFEPEQQAEARFYRTLRLGQTPAAQILAYAGLLYWQGMRLRGEVAQRQAFAGAGRAA